jgi:hypothetical protein
MPLRDFVCHDVCPFDVSRLGAFVASAQQDYESGTALHVVHAVTGAIVDPRLHDTGPDAPGVSQISVLHSANTGDDPGNGVIISQTV